MAAQLVMLESSVRVMVKRQLVLNVNKDTIVRHNSPISSLSHAQLVADVLMVYRLNARRAIINQMRFNQLVRHVPTATSAMEVV